LRIIFQKKIPGFFLFLFIGDLISVAISLVLSYYLRIILPSSKGIFPFRYYAEILPLFIFLHFLIASSLGLYKVKFKRVLSEETLNILATSFLTAVCVLAVVSYFGTYMNGDTYFEISRLFLLIYIFISSFFMLVLRKIGYLWLEKFYFPKNQIKTAICGYNELGRLVADRIKRLKRFGMNFCGFIDDRESGEEIIGRTEDLKRIISENRINEIFIALPLEESSKIKKIIEISNDLLVDTRLVIDLLHEIPFSSKVEDFEGIPVLNVMEIPLRGWGMVLKRIMDIILSFVGLILFLPFFPLLAILIKVTSPGKVFYVQERFGMDGKIFKLYKFRTMIENAEKETGPVWATDNDPRVTPIGKFLRKFSIDEIPQLINVLKGDMSLVGPRPERPFFVENFKEKIPRYMLRHKVKSGITGWAQVHGLRGNTPLEERIKYDLYYIDNWSIFLDVKIIWMTLWKGFIDKKTKL
jgi:exopolysaccharide biosynthesis polyprenyl glycosylphosphotransferase